MSKSLVSIIIPTYIRTKASKRTLVTSLARRSGLSWAILQLPRRASLIVLTYHRVCRSAGVRGDPHVISATPDAFERQMRQVRREFRVVGLDEAIAHVSSVRSRGCVVLITFDDGYRDNYQQAFPILCSLGLTATFFLTTSFIGSCVQPWWDRIAYAVRHTSKSTIFVRGNSVGVGMTNDERLETVRRLLRAYYELPGSDASGFVQEIEESCEARIGHRDRIFLNWEEAETMLAAGMDIGAHTHTHPVLSRISARDQYLELLESRKRLEQRLGRPVRACAYPVGNRTAFDTTTIAAAKAAGYRVAFTFDQIGFNRAGATDLLSLSRAGVDPEVTLDLLRMRMAVLATTGRVFV